MATLDIAVRLSVDPRKADQNIRGSVVLPKGTGKKFRVLVFAKGEKEKEAVDAGAEFVGGDDLVEKIQGGWMDFDRVEPRDRPNHRRIVGVDVPLTGGCS